MTENVHQKPHRACINKGCVVGKKFPGQPFCIYAGAMPAKKTPKPSDQPHERAIWRGSISFGLVQIPVGLFRAESDNDLHFTMLDKRDHAPVRFVRENGKTGKPIKWNDIVKGYEYQRGDYIIMTDEDFAKANVKATGGIDIMDFVEASSVDPLYYSKPYYLLPQDKGEKTYVLLRESLRRADKVGVAKIVIRTRQHLALVRVYADALVLELLRFPHELRPVQELNFPARGLRAAGISDKEVAMATSLIESMSGTWQPETYRDSYHEDLVALIERKQRSGEKAEPKPSAKVPAKSVGVVDIMQLLQRSVAARGKAGKKVKAQAAADKAPAKGKAQPAKAKSRAKSAPAKAKKSTARKASSPRGKAG